jgi:hypothetical protein
MVSVSFHLQNNGCKNMFKLWEGANVTNRHPMEDSYSAHVDHSHNRVHGLVRPPICPCHRNPSLACCCRDPDKYQGTVVYPTSTLHEEETENANDVEEGGMKRTRKTSFIE